MPKYEIHGPVGAVGDYATAHDFQQSGIDVSKLAEQLVQLCNAMKRENEWSPEGNKASEIAIVEEARDAASRGDGPTALRCLKKIGTWALDVANKIGIDLAAEVIKKLAAI